MAAYWYQAHYGFADPFGTYASAWSPVSSLPHALKPNKVHHMHDADAAPTTGHECNTQYCIAAYTTPYCCLLDVGISVEHL